MPTTSILQQFIFDNIFHTKNKDKTRNKWLRTEVKKTIWQGIKKKNRQNNFVQKKQ